MTVRTIAAMASLALIPGLAADLPGQEARRTIAPRSATDTTALPFSGGVMVGNTLYLSGTLGLAADGSVPGDPAVEARNVLDNVKRTLEQAGLTMDDLVTVQVFCSDVGLYDVFNRVYRTYFTGDFPARAFLGSGPLLRGARFEVQGIAVRR